MSRRVLRGFSASALAEARVRSGMSRGELARLAGVSTGAIGAWETERSTPQVDSLARVVSLLGIALDDVVLVKPADRSLADLRALTGLTQPQLAAELKMSTSALAALERGEAHLTDGAAANLGRRFGIPTSKIFEAYWRTRNRPAGAAS